MIEKILSSGRSGSERAALDVALELGVAHGGCIRPEAASELAAFEGLTTVSGVDDADCLERNVIEADGTLMITFGRPGGDADLARRLSLRHGRQLLHIDAARMTPPAAADLICSWIEVYRIGAIHVTGSDRLNPAGLHAAAVSILVFAVEAMRTGPSLSGPVYPLAPTGRPTTLEQAVRRLAMEMSLRDKAVVANCDPEATGRLFAPMVPSVVERFDLSQGNDKLLESCRHAGRGRSAAPEEAALVILKELWAALRKTHSIRVVK